VCIYILQINCYKKKGETERDKRERERVRESARFRYSFNLLLVLDHAGVMTVRAWRFAIITGHRAVLLYIYIYIHAPVILATRQARVVMTPAKILICVENP
jgi:hypothetical protein